MIKEKIYELLDCMEEYEKVNQEILEAADRRRELNSKVIGLKQKIGKIIQPLSLERKNIIIEKDGKYYTIFYNRKIETVEIHECITDKEADIKLSLKKLMNEK